MFRETVRWTDRLFSLTALRLVLWVVVAGYVYQGIFTDPFNIADWMDDHQFVAWEDSDRTTLLRFHQLPAWNPYWCGGTVAIAAPEDPFLSPDFLLRLIYGVANGRRLTVLLLVVLGFEGMYRLCRKLDASAVGATFAALVFGTCDRLGGFIHDGWIHFLGYELIPWVILGLVAGIDSWRWRIVGALFFAWIVLAPGTYPTPTALIAMAYVTLALFLSAWLGRRSADPTPPGRKWWQEPWAAIWLSGLTIGSVAFLLTFGKLVPTLMFVRQFTRVFTPTELHEPTQVFSGQWAHYGVVVVIALIGVATADLAAAIFAGGALIAYALACGDYGPHSPFHLLKALPIFGQLRFPDRYLVLFLFFLAVAAARGITRIEDALPAFCERVWQAAQRVRKKPSAPAPRALAWLAVGVATYLAYQQVRPLTEEVLEPMRIRAHGMYPEAPARTFEQPFRQHRGNRRDAHIFPPMNMGSLYCVAGNPIPESPLLRADLPEEEYPIDPTKATVKRLRWSPSLIELEVEAKEATSIYVNQNWAPEWRTNIGTVRAVEKLLTVDVPAGKHVVRLEYSDRFLVACLLVSLSTFLALVYVFGRDALRWLRTEWDALDTMPWWSTSPTPGVPTPAVPDEATSGPPEPPSEPPAPLAEAPPPADDDAKA